MSQLRLLGHDAVSSLDAGNANQRVPDETVLEFAAKNHRVVLTADRQDYIRLHRSGAAHCGIVVFTDGHAAEPTASRIDEALSDSMATGRFLARVDGLGYRFDP